MEATNSMSPIEYEVLFALFQLKEHGQPKAVLRDICREVNRRRKRQNSPTLSVQHIYYYLKNLAKRPFIKRENEKRVHRYTLVKGTFKLVQSPPLCIHINDSDFVLICDKTATCREIPSTKCVEDLVNRGRIVLPTKV